jgi:cell division protein FtsQ
MNENAKKRRQPTRAARMRPYWILWLLAFAVVVGILYFLATWDALKPHSVTVQGNKLVGTEAILAQAAVDPQKNMWLQNVGEIQKRVESIPYIDLARVHRFLPANIVIEVLERTPVAVVEGKNGSFLVDERERVLQEAPDAVKLPKLEMPSTVVPKIGGFFYDDDVTHSLNDMGAIESAHIEVGSLTHDKYGDLSVAMRNGVTVLFGDEADIDKKISLIQPILDQVAKQKKSIATIDVRAPSAPIVIYKK